MTITWPPDLDTHPDLAADVPATLWLGALMLADRRGPRIDPFPAELERLAAAYFELCPRKSRDRVRPGKAGP